MSNDNLPVAGQAANFFDRALVAEVPGLDQVPDMSEDEVLQLTRKLRIRQVAMDLDKNGGQMPSDPEERKIFLAQLKDLDSQVIKVKSIGAKEKASAADREASLAVQHMLRLLGDNPMRREAIGGTSQREVPSIKDAVHLPPITLVPDEIQVGLDTTTYDELMERNGNG